VLGKFGRVRTIRLRVTLREVQPRVIRVIDVPASVTLGELHQVLQIAVGWTDSHLHQFLVGDTRYSAPYPGSDFEDSDDLDETGVPLRELPDRLVYLYDFGDGWEHDVEVLGAGGDASGCVDGEGACPPEDCGGPHGYAELLVTLADRTDPHHQKMTGWVGDRLHPFDRDTTDIAVRQTVGEVPDSIRMLLDLTTSGVKLTPAGRLPRTVVRDVQQRRPTWSISDRPAATEDDLPPLVELHHLLRRAGLLRIRNGVLAPTKSAADDLDVIRRLRTQFPPHEFTTTLATRAIAWLAPRDEAGLEELAETVHPLLGYGWQCDGHDLTTTDVRRNLSRLAHLLLALDQIDGAWPKWRPGPAARSLLPAVTLLAPLLL
jgi:Plasmid pRiA4b ORF-3-like protein